MSGSTPVSEDGGDEAAALAAFDRWLKTIGDDEHVVDEESGLCGDHLHTVRNMAARGALAVRIPRLS